MNGGPTASEVHLPGLVLVDYEFEVPLRHRDPDGARIVVAAREAAAPDGRERPLLVYLQGGPGLEAPRPTSRPSTPGWLERALEDFRVLFVDQRGTGRSTPVGGLMTLGAEEQADYLTCFRADSIVADLELMRRAMGVERWSVIGQSFGGFCVLRYLSSAPEGLAEAFVCGGLAPVGHHPDEVYRATWVRTVERCRRYYRRYPADSERVRQLQDWLENDEVVLPRGDRLTPRMFRQLGWVLGMSDGAERLHYVVELPQGSPAFLHDVESGLPPFTRNPLYAVLNEACYADGTATGWSAARLQPAEYEQTSDLLTGEHVFPWMFDEYGALQPLRAAAERLADYEWPPLYDEKALAACEVPVAAVVYTDDMYVECRLSEETAALIPTMHLWLTNEFDHNGLRVDGAAILDRLIRLARDR